MKKLIALLLTIICIACIFGGCGNDTSKENPSKHVVSDAVITDAFLSFRYDIGGFSMSLRELLPKCCPDYKGGFATYEGTKTEHFNEEQIASLENGDYKEYLNNSYIVTISGPIMENPEIPNLVTEEDVIIKLLIIFDENDSVVVYSLIDDCSQLQTCATLLMF